MEAIFNFVLLDNTVGSYLIVAAIIVFVALFKKYLSRYVAGLLFRIIRKLVKGVDKETFINLVVAPLRTFLLILITIITLEKLNFPTTPIKLGSLSFSPDFRIYRITLHQLVDTVSVIILIFSFIWLLLRIIDFIALILEWKANLTADQTDNQLIVFFKDFFKVIIVINGFLLVLKFGLHLDIGNLITGLSIAGAAIALSTRESLENLIASFIIFFDKPFTTGDLVKVQNITGTVEKIGLRSTRIRTDQKTFVTVPNKQMVDSILDNLSLRSQRRAFVQLELQAATPPEKIQELIKKLETILLQHKNEIDQFTVLLADINKNAFYVQVEFFTPAGTIAAFNAVRQKVNLEMIEALTALEIRLASKDAEVGERQA